MNVTTTIRPSPGGFEDRGPVGLRFLSLLSLSAVLVALGSQPLRAGTFTTDFSSQPANVQLFGDPGDGSAGAIADGVLKLTTTVGSLQASMVIDDLDAGNAVSGFTATFKLLIGGGSGADGFSFCFANDLPDGTWGEEGVGTGIIIAFDSYDNGNGEAPAIDVKVGGTELATTKISPRSVLAANTFLPVRINLDSDGTLDVSYGNLIVYTNLYTGFTAQPGRFGFGARTGGSYDNHWVDDVSITTSTAPQTQPAHPLVATTVPSGTGVSPEPVITITVKDFTTQLNTSTVQLKVNDTVVTPTVTKDADTTTITYDPPGLFDSESLNTIQLVYADNGTPPFYTTNVTTFRVVKYSNVILPNPIYLETFDTTAEGTVPAGWLQTNATTSINAWEDLDDYNSDSYLGWTVIDRTRLEGTPFDARRLNVAPGYLNNVLITNLVFGKCIYAESDNRSGNQIQMLFSPDFDLTGKKDIYVAFNSIYEQNQDSLGAVEYSIDQGVTWNPILIMLDEPDVIKNPDGTVDAATTLNTIQTDTPQVDDGAGGTRRTAYGEFILSRPIESLGPYIQGRVNDNPTESKRVEVYRLPKADNQAKVRFRFVQAGTGSWYFGIDNFGLYSIPTAPVTHDLLEFAFNEGTGTNTVDSVNGLVGTLGVGMAIDPNNVPVVVTNSPARTASDRAISLNGNGAALVVNDTYGNSAPNKILAFATDQPFTIESWINIAANDTKQYEGLVAYGRSYKLGLNNQQLQFTLYGIVDINSGIFPSKGAWHHVAAAWTPGTGVEFFLDGTSVTNIAETRVPRAYQNYYLTIGSENVGATALANTFQGMMDRVRIHAAALTAADLDSVAATPKATLASTVVSYSFNETTWPFANASGLQDRKAVPNPSPRWTNDTPSGKAGDYALSFAPGTQVIVPNPANVVQLDPAKPDFTMQAWVKFAGNPSTRQVLYYNNGPGGALSFSVNTDRTVYVTTLGVKDQSSAAKIPDDGVWHHIAVVHENGKEFRFYVDGALANTQAYTGSVIFTRTNQVFYIGSEPTFGLQYTGMLDRLKVSNTMLTPAEFDFPAGGPPPSVVTVSALAGAIGVLFDKPVNAATATNPANYAVAGATVTSATLIRPNYVVLGVSAVPALPFTVTVNGIASTLGDVMTSAAAVEATTAGATIPTDLVAYWSFDGHLLDSIDGFDGAARGKVPVGFVDSVPGFGKALHLNGTNYVEIPGSSNALQFAKGSLSIAGWFRVEKFDKSWQALIAKGEDTNYRLARRDVGNSIAYAGGVAEGADDVPSVNDGKWHHFVAITDAARAKFGTALYVDGVIHGINTNAATLLAGTKNLYIGENPEALNRQWVGEIDDIGLWKRVLAPEEISLLYNGGQGMPVSALPGVVPPLPAVRPYSIGLNFGSDEPNGGNQGVLAPSAVAGALPQANWNNLAGASGTNVNNIVADTDYETAVATAVTVSWSCPNTWASTGRGEENNQFTGADRTLMLGYLDTGAPSTTAVTITNLPTQLTREGYDVYVYAMGGVGGRGGGYRIVDATTKAVLKDYVRVVGITNSTAFVEAPIDPASTNYAAGNYMVFTDLTAQAITVEATTDHGYGFGGTHRAPINAIQLVGMPAPVGPALSIEATATGIVITFEGTLESADVITGPWTAEPGTSPLTVTPAGAAKFYRAKQ